LAGVLALTVCAISASTAQAGQLRVWTSAVVVSDSITLGDLVELRGVETEEGDELRSVVITEAPPPGGSRIIHYEMIRAALTAKGVNFAKLTLSGAAQCEVRRPAAPQQVPSAQANTTVDHLDGAERSAQANKSTKAEADAAGQTLRQAIEEHFQKAMSRYGGRVEVLFDSHDLQALELTGPALQFQIRVERPSVLGLCAVEVEVFRESKPVQRIPLVVRTALSRNVVTARRAINQGATLESADVALMSVSFTHLDELGVDDTALVLGQRAKRFIPSGTAIELESLEAVPLVLRGQLITLVSEVGGVRVVTTAKAGANGKRGETIRVRTMDDSKVELDAVVTGPGEARAAGSSGAAEDSKPRLVLGGIP